MIYTLVADSAQIRVDSECSILSSDDDDARHSIGGLSKASFPRGGRLVLVLCMSRVCICVCVGARAV